MAKKSAKLNMLYLIGMVLVIVGCFLPLTSHSTFGLNGASAFDAIKADGNGVLKIGSILALVGAIAGVVFCFVSVKGVPMKLISAIVSIVGGLYVVFKYMFASDLAKGFAKFAGKAFGTKPSIGLIIIIIGWIIALVGIFQKKDM